jgi:putative ABC transport system permease protein
MAAALMIGLALVTFVTVLAAGLKASVNHTLDKNSRTDISLQNTQGSFLPISEGVGKAAARVRGVRLVSRVKITNVKVESNDAGKTTVRGVDPRTFPRVFKFDFTRGS